MLTHVCPNCKKEHLKDTTPEPDKLCPVCELEEKRTVEVYIPLKMWVNNNVYCKEVCVICNDHFKPSMILYEIPALGYMCQDCADKLEVKKDHLDWDVIQKVQERFCNGGVDDKRA